MPNGFVDANCKGWRWLKSLKGGSYQAQEGCDTSFSSRLDLGSAGGRRRNGAPSEKSKSLSKVQAEAALKRGAENSVM